MLPHVVVVNAFSLDVFIDWAPVDAGLFCRLAGDWREDTSLLKEYWQTLDVNMMYSVISTAG
jgi:hypothetical protein